MLAWTWQTWPDLLTDSGQELYVAWRLSEGAVLYRDVFHVQGPLSPYLNALWFRLFGPSLLTLVLCNLALVAGLAGLLYGLLSSLGSRYSATVACLLFVVIFAFRQFDWSGMFNYLTPYRHETTHGVLLSVAALFSLSLHRPREGLLPIGTAGLCLGLLFLTKGEVFLAGFLGVGLGLGLLLWAERPSTSRLWLTLSTFFMGLLAPAVLALLALSTALPPQQALEGVLGSWPATFHGAYTNSHFGRGTLGLWDIRGNLRLIVLWACGYALVFLPLVGLSLVVGRWRRVPVIAIAASLVLATTVLSLPIEWGPSVRPLPLAMLALAAISFVQYVRGTGAFETARLRALRLALVVFAGAMLGKLGLEVRLGDYGFVHAMPATLVLVVALLSWVPGWIARRSGDGRLFAAAATATLLPLTLAVMVATSEILAAKQHWVGQGADAFLADERGMLVNEALEYVRRYAGPDQTLAVLPEGAMLNYLARRPNPTPYTALLPTEVAFYGEGRILWTYRERAPDLVALVHRDTTEYGARFFGSDYAREIGAWLAANYRPLVLLGSHPFESEQFGILLLERVGKAVAD